MSEQEVLFSPGPETRFDPEREGIWKRFLEDDGLHVNLTAWRRARAEASFVGTCRHCGGYLRPLPTDDPGPDDDMSGVGEWLLAKCVDHHDQSGAVVPGGGCGHEFAAPDGKVLQRSARHSRMPRTFIRNRAGVIAEPRANT